MPEGWACSLHPRLAGWWLKVFSYLESKWQESTFHERLCLAKSTSGMSATFSLSQPHSVIHQQACVCLCIMGILMSLVAFDFRLFAGLGDLNTAWLICKITQIYRLIALRETGCLRQCHRLDIWKVPLFPQGSGLEKKPHPKNLNTNIFDHLRTWHLINSNHCLFSNYLWQSTQRCYNPIPVLETIHYNQQTRQFNLHQF